MSGSRDEVLLVARKHLHEEAEAPPVVTTDAGESQDERARSGESHYEAHAVVHIDAMACHSADQPEACNLEDVMNLPAYLRRVA